MGDSASERLATSDVGLSAEGIQAVPPMLMGESAPRRLATPEAGLSAEGMRACHQCSKILPADIAAPNQCVTHGGVSRGRL